MALTVTVTNAGRAEIVNADNTGTAPVAVVEIAFGTGEYEPDPAQTALQNEVKRVTTIAGHVVADDTLHTVAKDESNDNYDVAEFGLFSENGTLLAVYSVGTGAGPFAQKASASLFLLAVDIIFSDINANSLSFGDISFTNPPASEIVAGVARIATLSQTNAGTDNSTIVSPKKLADYFLFKLGQVSTVANTFLRRSADNTQFEARTPQVVANELAPLLPVATSTAPGPVELATQVEMNAGSNTSLVPPVKVIATYVANQISALVNAAPSSLDTLNELAAALGDDPNFATTVMHLIDSKLDKTGKAANADLFDGLDSGAFLRANANSLYSGGVLTVANDDGDLIDSAKGYQHGLQIRQAALGADAFMTFHISNQHALYFGLDGSTNKLSVGGWSEGAASYALYHEGNPPTVSEVAGLQAALAAKATPGDITTAINNLVGAAPGALNTLNELADALGDDPDFATTITNALAGKLDKMGKAADAELLDGVNSTQFMRSDSTQNFSGSLNYTPNTGPILTLDGKTALYRHSSSGALSFGCDDGLIIGAGESRAAISGNVNVVAENLYFGAEGSLYFYTSPDNWSSGWNGRHEMRFGNDGELTIRGHRVYHEGQNLPTGVIVLWSGLISSIPSGWVLCNGQNGTPDLRNRFVAGAAFDGNVGNIGGGATKTTNSAGAHNHGGTRGHALTVDEMPAHNHSFSVLADETGTGNYAAAARLSNSIGTVKTSSVGSGNSHSHSISSSGNHTHSVNVTPPYYSLAYIMKT